MDKRLRLIGPFRQIVTMNGMAMKGPLKDQELEIIEEGGILIQDGRIEALGPFSDLAKIPDISIEEWDTDAVVWPGLIDAHTHLCYIASRAADYAKRLAGVSYLDIARAGGGIRYTMAKTRGATEQELIQGMHNRLAHLYRSGVTTVEVKTGYGLSLESELRMLRAIQKAADQAPIDFIPTCLAAHIIPDEYEGDEAGYLKMLLEELLPKIKEEDLSNRIDIFVEDTAFSLEGSAHYLRQAKAMGFDLTVHADQFSPGGSALAVQFGAKSADHLEASTDKEVALLAQSDTVAMALPGASMGLGEPFTPARKLLDAGACLAIASDWNPGSGPMGDLLLQAAILGAYEKLTLAETMAGVTYRAAHALGLRDRGRLAPGLLADLAIFPCDDYRDILYHQGRLRPNLLFKEGQEIKVS